MTSHSVPSRSASADTDSGGPLPAIDLRHLLRMTDDTGIAQHAVFAVPDPNHGYCIDDNARALIAAVLHAQLTGEPDATPLHRYLGFVAYAFDDASRRFRNFMSYDRRWLEPQGSHDSQGRALWALGIAAAGAPAEHDRALAADLLRRAVVAMDAFEHLRSSAFALLGLDAHLAVHPGDAEAAARREAHAQRLLAHYRDHATPDWPWWEHTVTYDNAKLPQALIVSGRALGDEAMIEAGLVSLRWLLEMQRGERGCLSIIGNRGWLPRGSKRAAFDQQPLEAHALVEACLAAHRLTGDPLWRKEATRCFGWFTGDNDIGEPLYDPVTGGCRDGLEPTGVNRNQGAESTLAYLLSVLALHAAAQKAGPGEPAPR